MRYKDHDFQYDMERSDLTAADDAERSGRRQYRRRSARSTRRNGKEAKSYAGLGMAGRRNRRWSW